MRIKKKFFSLILALTFLSSFLVPGISAQAVDNNQLKVHFIDVGQADAILVQQGSNTMLIDGGNNADGQLVKNYISALGINKIDVVVGTHTNEEHIGGLGYIINFFEIGRVYFPELWAPTKIFDDFTSAVKNKGLSLNTALEGGTFKLGNASITILAPNKDDYEYYDVNSYSIVLKVQYGNNSFLLTGDAGEVSEDRMLARGINLKADVLKISNHGAKNSTNYPFLNAVTPNYAVISLGNNNGYENDTQEVLNRLKVYGVSTFRTDLQGTIVATSDGHNITFNTNPANGGEVKNGWVFQNGYYYYYSNNVAKTGWLFDNGEWYYLKSDGVMATGWQLVEDNWYLLKGSGAMVTGWQLYGGFWYYLESSGAMKTGWLYTGGTWYYLKDSGAMATGWQLVGKTWYYLENSGAMKTGWLLDGTTWYYLESSGAMKIGWALIGSKWYYFYNNGAMAKNTVIDGYKLGADGAWTD